ncbi:MAG: carboxypeptidase M32, partial [candidate division Zixibacteria bacterium]|nr:carboxypeptidase M32 [candidate division Zixibacteria bacterium]
YIPRKGAENRANQLSYLAGLAHKKFTDPKIGELLTELERSDLVKDEYSNEAVTIRETRYDYDKEVKLPQKLVEELSHTATMAQGVWAKARGENDFASFQPYLEKMIKLSREKAECFGYKNEAYDALLNEYEPGSSVEFVSKVFSGFKDDLVALVSAIGNAKKKPNMDLIENNYPIDLQETFGRSASAAIGFDYAGGRLDKTAHPFCTGIGPGDTRITTRFNPNHFGQALFGILHEAGHGIYDQGLPAEHHGTPRAEAVSLGIHESQSRMWENQVGRGKPFWKHFFPRAQQMFPELLGDVALDDFYFAINDVRPSLIRVEADEVTYNLHILLRFEMEHALISGQLQAKDAPEAWNEKFQQFFGITPPTVGDGCMQDVHWSAGLFGYFPTYTLGNLYSAQFFAKAKEELPGLEDKFAIGDFSDLKKWLNEKIHTHGRRYRAEKLVEVVTGNKLSHEPLMQYLKNKFGKLYEL